MTQDLTRRFNFKHEGSNTSLGDVLIVGEDNVTHPPTPQALRVRPGPESMGTAAHTKQADAAREAIQARKIYELYEQGMGLAVHPGDEGETAQMARRNLGQARDQTDELEAVAVHRTIVRLLEYLTLTPGGRLATESNRIPDPETTLRFLGESPQGEELGENLPSWERYTYHVAWSEEDMEFVGTCDELPSLTWLALTPVQAYSGIRNLAAQAAQDADAQAERTPAEDETNPTLTGF